MEDFKVKDISEAEFGRKEISIAESEMPGLMALREEYSGKSPLNKSQKNLNKELVLKKLKPLLEDSSIKKIGQNIKFDFIVLFKHGITISTMEDTMLMSFNFF